MAARSRSSTLDVGVIDREVASSKKEPGSKKEPRTSPTSKGPVTEVGASQPVQIPDRRYFRIGEVAKLLGVKPHVLRYWESEFRELRPSKSQRNQRLYRKRDVEVLVAIRRLLYAERFTIAGAKDRLKEILAHGELQSITTPKVPVVALKLDRLRALQAGLEDLIGALDRRDKDLAPMD